METTNGLFINGYCADTESYIRCAGIDVGEYTAKIVDSSCIVDFETTIQEQINNAIRQINRVYIPEQEDNPKYIPNYRLGFL